ncbi:universal stress protein [Halosegnis marinus]|uniref:Universal stress protein n=1 Tax=Halosegnis marinus TaxID=3034023 RepID=A0ABD5ZRZ6_9EURY|nr:universal stress protein [Halosegnis sp. DT85]
MADSVRAGRYRAILVPTDGSRGAMRAVERALDIGRQSDATIHVMHVIDERSRAETPALSSEELVLEKLGRVADETIERVAAEAERAGLPAVRHSCRGVPHERIREYAERNDVDLIVMGVHGVGREGRPHMGSTTARVRETSTVPVLPV